MTFALDVNVLIALVDPAHVGHDAAHRWFEPDGKAPSATCPITGMASFASSASPNIPTRPERRQASHPLSASSGRLPGVTSGRTTSACSTTHVEADQVLTSAQVTDTYLLALAATHGGKLATFDRRLSIKAVKGGKSALHVIEG